MRAASTPTTRAAAQPRRRAPRRRACRRGASWSRSSRPRPATRSASTCRRCRTAQQGHTSTRAHKLGKAKSHRVRRSYQERCLGALSRRSVTSVRHVGSRRKPQACRCSPLLAWAPAILWATGHCSVSSMQWAASSQPSHVGGR